MSYGSAHTLFETRDFDCVESRLSAPEQFAKRCIVVCLPYAYR